MKNRIFAFILLVSLFAACLAGCGSSEDEPSGYYALTSNKDKLFYVSARPETNPGDHISALWGEDAAAILDSFENAGSAKLEGAVNVSAAKVQGKDLLENVGGAVELEMTSLWNSVGTNTDLSAKMNGMSIKFDVDADKNGALLNAPFVFTKPVYLDYEGVLGSLASLAVGSGTDIGEIKGYLTALENYVNTTLTEDNLKHLASLLIDAVPEECITSEKVSFGEPKSKYVTKTFSTECITLEMKGEQISAALQSLGDRLAEDEVFKSVVTGFVSCLPPELFEEDSNDSTDNSADGVDYSDVAYAKLLEELDKLAEKVNEDARIKVSRYFYMGESMRIDIIVGDDKGVESLVLCKLVDGDDYQFSMCISNGIEALFNLVCGARGQLSGLDVSIRDYESDLVYNENENGEGEFFEENKVFYDVANLSVIKGNDKIDITANIKGEEDSEDVVIEGAVDCAKGTFVFDGKKGDSDIFGMDGSVVTKDGQTTVSGNYTFDGEGLRATENYTVVLKEGFISTEYIVTAKSDDGSMDIAGDIRFSVDTNSEVSVEAPDRSDNDYVIDGVDDFEHIGDILSPFIKNSIGGDSEEKEL